MGPLPLSFLLFLLFSSSSFQEENKKEESEQLACNSIIYCNNTVLDVIQLSGIYNDSKTFVDMMMNKDPLEVQEAFDALGPSPSTDAIQNFLDQNFYPAGFDVETFVPEDYDPSPEKFSEIADPNLRQWAFSLNDLWLSLGVRVKDLVYQHPERSSLIPLEKGFISPSGGASGRFREMYYWDSYWTIEGLLKCNMKKTAKGMIENFFQLITELGFVPNGSRDYYRRRSQPPLLPSMVRAYFEATQDIPFLSKAMPYLEREYNFWMTRRAQTMDDGKTVLNFYRADSNVPRPEGYKEDKEKGENLPPPLDGQLYRNYASGAESGWDFSSRWLYDNHLSTIHTDKLIPTDLNSLLLQNEVLLSMFHCILNNKTTNTNNNNNKNSEDYAQKGWERWVGINEYLWSEELGSWGDLDIETKEVRKVGRYPSDYFPLLFPSFDPSLYPSSCINIVYSHMGGEEGEGEKGRGEGEKVPSYSGHVGTALNTLNSSGLLDYVGGVPTSLHARGVLEEDEQQQRKEEKREGQQWDFPNSWAPLQMFMVSLMRRQSLSSPHLLPPSSFSPSSSFSSSPSSSSSRPTLPSSKINQFWEEKAFELAQKWVITNYNGWVEDNAMFEKYDCRKQGPPGTGGEYVTQVGFGWTNGVIFQLLNMYPDKLSSS